MLANDDHIGFTVTWGIYQDMIDAYQAEDRTQGHNLMSTLIDKLKCGVPEALPELRSLGRTLQQRRDDILAYFTHPGTSNAPTEAIKCRCRHLIAYADFWVMPTSEACVLVMPGSAGGLSA